MNRLIIGHSSSCSFSFGYRILVGSCLSIFDFPKTLGLFRFYLDACCFRHRCIIFSGKGEGELFVRCTLSTNYLLYLELSTCCFRCWFFRFLVSVCYGQLIYCFSIVSYGCGKFSIYLCYCYDYLMNRLIIGHSGSCSFSFGYRILVGSCLSIFDFPKTLGLFRFYLDACCFRHRCILDSGKGESELFVWCTLSTDYLRYFELSTCCFQCWFRISISKYNSIF